MVVCLLFSQTIYDLHLSVNILDRKKFAVVFKGEYFDQLLETSSRLMISNKTEYWPTDKETSRLTTSWCNKNFCSLLSGPLWPACAAELSVSL